ncbi:restriction endonuclease subunit S [Rhizobium leguminosarum]|uniref:restriction endonuclease subunit S n=1 Tax=Rhizobium leguminosarum TaxID=384 RepID=UPI001C9636A2|nr:restriction endonuclease subunit S [Rhizobium leguminosarum]MBY5544700.1 restriction endonuclease subunit S [Rhizobium leguminosarum]
MTIIARLGDLVEFYAGFGFPNQYQGSVEGEIPFAKVSDISRSLEDGGNAIYKAANYVSGEVAHKLRAKPFPTGTIVFAKIGEAIRKNRRALTTREMLFDNNVMGVRPMNEKIDIDYLFRYLDTVDFYKLANTTAVPSLRKSVLGELQIPLPPLDEQKRIAAILDKADQLRQKRRQAIALLDSLTQSIFLEMFGEAAAHTWPTATIAEVALDMRTGPFGSQLLHSEFVDDGIAVLGIDNAVSNRFEWGKARFITEDKYRQLSRYTVRPDDVLITIMGTCGRCAVVPDDIPTAINTKHLCCITLDTNQMLPQYLHASFLNNPGVLRQLGVQAKGAVMPGLNMGIIKSLNIRIPPMALQQAFKARLAALAQQMIDAEIAATQSDALVASLQHRAFSGQL